MLPKIIIISGGIGSGKSVVCRVLTAMGYDVYDCDTMARLIMDNDPYIKRKIAEFISPLAINANGDIDRPVLAEIVFNDTQKLETLNAIVHAAVRDDICSWRSAHDCPFVFVETAIMYQSGLDRMADQVWEVTAPDDIRVQRVCRRNNLTPQQVLSRIEAQNIVVDNPHPHIHIICNDGIHSLIAQINNLLSY